MFRRALLVAAVVAMVWAIAVRMLGPLAVTLAGIRLSSSDPGRPLLICAIAAASYVALSGLTRTRRELAAARAHITASRASALLAGVIFIVGVANNSWTAGGADSYAYVTQADLLLQGRLTVPVPLAARAPWPEALTTFTPFGYRALSNEAAIAPATGPGLPLMMAAWKLAFGHRAAFVVVPLTGALLLWWTFLIGSRLHSSRVGLATALLVATSPTFLMMFKSQMSDVPAAAFWTLATYAALGRTTRAAVGAGAAAAVAILVRPNLVPLAAVLFVWLLLPAFAKGRAAGERVIARFAPAIAFAAATLPACLAIAAINTRLYGSPLSSGYGDLGQLFSIEYVPVTLARYAAWFTETQTPLAFAGVILLMIAPRSVWRTPALRANARLLAAVAATTWALYSVYQPFGAWWFLRFLLPSWPALLAGTVVLVAWIFERWRWGTRMTAAVVIALGVHGIVVASQRDVFPDNEGERRYATVAMFVQQLTEPQAMILASIHAGPTRYYAGRATMRFDLLDPGWLDRAAEWLQREGRHPYVLVEDWEMPLFSARFAGSGLGDLGASPMLAYRAYNTSGTVYLFDLLRRDGPTLALPPIKDPRPRCPEPAAPPEL
jgi:Dolichyl-phosphate-mannose-protein mannosyltransferase